MEERGVSTKLKIKQQKSYLPTPTIQCERKIQRVNKTTKKTLQITDVIPQEHLPVQGQETEGKTNDTVVTKVPEDIYQLLMYTQQKIEELTWQGRMSTAQKAKNCELQGRIQCCGMFANAYHGLT